MGIFGQRKDTIEWEEFRSDVLFYKWKEDEIKSGSRLVVRTGQNVIFYSNGHISKVFTQEGNFDIETEIVPILSTVQGLFDFRRDTGLRAEVYFVNAKELTMNWGTRQRIMIPTDEVPSGIPVGMNGNLIIEFRDYLKFIEKIAGIKQTFCIGDVSERILGELDGIIAECVLGNRSKVGLNALISIQANSRKLGKMMAEELDKELFEIGLGVRDINIISVDYPPEVQQMAEKVAGQSFVTNTGKYATVAMADGMASGNNQMASMAAQMAMGAQMAQQMSGAAAVPAAQGSESAASADPAANRFCPKCRKMVSGKFCSECGTETV
ncbi:MAG: SPFH domain-containing protein [Oscillospiraceae bacterium]